MTTPGVTVNDTVGGTVCNAQQYDRFLQSSDSSSPSISCLTHGQSIGLAVSIWFIVPAFVTNLSRVQLAAEASLLSCICIVVIFIWIGVRPTSFHVSVLLTRCCVVERPMV